MTVDGPWAVVTEASSGIGRAKTSIVGSAIERRGVRSAIT